MQLLFLSNYYPPVRNGGYEQLCEEVAGELARRGHRVTVLTSGDHDGARGDGGQGVLVRRLLHLEVEGGVAQMTLRLLRDRERLERANLDYLRSAVWNLEPDAILVWGMWNVPRSVPALAEQLMPGRVVYYLCDYWPSLPSAYLQQWKEPSARGLSRLPKRILGRSMVARLSRETAVPLELERPVCVSRAVRDTLVQSGVSVAHARIIYNGIALNSFPFTGFGGWHANVGALKLLYSGRLTREKGVHTAVQALAWLRLKGRRSDTLTIVGSGERPYVGHLKRLVRDLHLEERVVFLGAVPRSEMPSVLAEHDVLLFPSEWNEPLARTVMEAMAVGLVVVGTSTGGTGELLGEDETGITFPAGDAETLAVQIERLAEDRGLGSRLIATARRRVEERFNLSRTVDELEQLAGEG